ncbi:MAG: hypothetical protein WC289_05380 [Patescibacteria group bacterium]|jgi:hypothetical protein
MYIDMSRHGNFLIHHALRKSLLGTLFFISALFWSARHVAVLHQWLERTILEYPSFVYAGCVASVILIGRFFWLAWDDPPDNNPKIFWYCNGALLMPPVTIVFFFHESPFSTIFTVISLALSLFSWVCLLLAHFKVEEKKATYEQDPQMLLMIIGIVMSTILQYGIFSLLPSLILWSSGSYLIICALIIVLYLLLSRLIYRVPTSRYDRISTHNYT